MNTAYAVSAKGWRETTIFEKYIKEVFLPAVGPERPVLLVFDGHSHVDLSVIELLAAQEITVLKLPAHSSHILQPLECSTMKPMKDKWDSELVKWQRLHVGAKLPKQEFARLITMIWNDLNPVIIQNGFRKTGIYPVNRHVINKEKFDSSSWSNWEKHNRQQNDKSIVDDTDRSGKENPEGSYTQKDLVLDSAKENKVPSLTHACLKTINHEVRLPEININTNSSFKPNRTEKKTSVEQGNDAKASTNISEE